MLRRLSQLVECKIIAKDGLFGFCRDFLFSDDSWQIRYLVANSGRRRLPIASVLLALSVVEEINFEESLIRVNLTRKQIEDGPPLEKHAPVSRRYELMLSEYFEWGCYWQGEDYAPEDTSLRSANEVLSYCVEHNGSQVGSASELFFDDERWKILYLLGHSTSSKSMFIVPNLMNTFDWYEKSISIDVSPSELSKLPSSA